MRPQGAIAGSTISKSLRNRFMRMLAVLGRNVRDRELLTVLADSNVDLGQDLALVEETAQAYLEKKGEGFSLAFHDDTFEDGVSTAPARDERSDTDRAHISITPLAAPSR